MSEKEQLEYLNQTNKKPIYFNKQTNEFKAWLKKQIIKTDDEKLEEIISERSDKEFKDVTIQEIWVKGVSADFISDPTQEDIDLQKLETLEGKDFDQIKEEESLIEEFELETGKKAVMSDKSLSKEYLAWKNETNDELEKMMKDGIQMVIDEEANKESVNLNKEKMSLNYFIRGKTNKEVELERIEKHRKNYEKEQKLKEIERIRKLEEMKEDRKERKIEKDKEKAIKKKFNEITAEIDVNEIEQMMEDFKKESKWTWMSPEEILEWFKEKIGQEKLEQQQQLHNQYKLETGKDFMTLKNKLRIDYSNWKNKKLKEDNRKKILEEIEELTPIHEAVEKYKLETGKNPLTLKDTVRKSFLKWIKENE